MAITDRPVLSVIPYDENSVGFLIDQSGVQAGSDVDHAILKGRISGAVAGTVSGYIATAATTIVAVRGTIYTEQTTNFTATLVSSSASDAAASTGTRTVKVTYYDQTMAGPFTETLTMNGTSNVTSVGTNYCFIEKIESVTVGSNGTNVGTISLKNGGTTVATIAISDGITFFAHHYVQPSKLCLIRRLYLGANGATGSCFLRSALPLTANSFEEQIMPQFRVVTAQPQQVYDMTSFAVAGPARVTLYSKPDASTASTTFGGFSYYEL